MTPTLPPGPTPISQIKQLNINGLQSQVNQANQKTVGDTNGTLSLYWNEINSQANQDASKVPNQPPRSIPWQVLDSNMAGTLFDKLQAAYQLMTPNASELYDETKAISTIQVPLPSATKSVGIGTDYMPVFVIGQIPHPVTAADQNNNASIVSLAVQSQDNTQAQQIKLQQAQIAQLMAAITQLTQFFMRPSQ